VSNLRTPAATILATALAALIASPLQAAIVQVTVRVENLAPANSISFAPLRFGFNNGTFDAFNIGQAATAPIISVAEGGSGSAWFPAFAAADPTAVLGSVPGAVTPGNSATSMTFNVDTAVNQFFTFASMVVPSNDLFIGNDDAQEYRLFDAAGNLLLGAIEVIGSEIWNAGSEAADPLNAAFIAGGTNALRTPENGVVGFSFSELAVFNGLTTAAGYVFSNAALRGDTGIYRISFQSSVIPEPATMSLMGFGMIGAVGIARRRRSLCQVSNAA
jgi:PEP-CTERM motif